MFNITVYTLCRAQPHSALKNDEVIQRMMALYKPDPSLPIIPWLEKPEYCSQHIWDIIMPCWQREASQRPSFKNIHSALRAEKQRCLLNSENHIQEKEKYYEEFIYIFNSSR